MADKIDVGVLTQAGGAHLSSYFSALAETPEVAQVSIADASGECFVAARKVLKEKFAGEYRSPAKLLAKHAPKLALVSMDAASSPQMIDVALDAGCHALSEKPGCLSAADFAPLVRKAESKHLEVMLSLANRQHAPVREARRIVREGLLGKLYGLSIHLVADQARLTNAAYRDSWQCSKALAGGGNLTWLGIHWLDLALFITGLQVEQVTGFYDNVGGQRIDVEDSASISLRLNHGVLGTMLSGYYLDQTFKQNVQGYQSQLEVWGEAGWLRLSLFAGTPLEWYSSRSGDPPQVQRFLQPRSPRGYQPFVQAAVKFAAEQAEPPITSQESLHVLQAIYGFYNAAKTGKTERIA